MEHFEEDDAGEEGGRCLRNDIDVSASSVASKQGSEKLA
jgi:hypothetical protein